LPGGGWTRDRSGRTSRGALYRGTQQATYPAMWGGPGMSLPFAMVFAALGTSLLLLALVLLPHPAPA